MALVSTVIEANTVADLKTKLDAALAADTNLTDVTLTFAGAGMGNYVVIITRP